MTSRRASAGGGGGGGGKTNDDLCLPFVYDIKRKHTFIKNKADFREFERVLQRALLIGMDTERKPDFGARDLKANPTALLQIAIRTSGDTNFEEFCYLIDLFYMDEPSLCQLDELLKEVFMNSSVIKIGQSIKNDFIELHRSYPQMKSFTKGISFLDTTDMIKRLTPSVTRLVSLKDIALRYLHVDLLKTCQLSDWNKRPLSDEQQHYACCDAVILIRLFDAMAGVALSSRRSINSKKTGSCDLTTNPINNNNRAVGTTITTTTTKRPRACSTSSNVSNYSVGSCTSGQSLHTRSNSFDFDDSADISKYSEFAQELGGVIVGHRTRSRSRTLSMTSTSSNDDDDEDDHIGSESDHCDFYSIFKSIYISFDLEAEETKWREERSARSVPVIISRNIPIFPLKINKNGTGKNIGNKRKHVRSFGDDDEKDGDNPNSSSTTNGNDAATEASAVVLARKERKREKRLRQKLQKKDKKEQIEGNSVPAIV